MILVKTERIDDESEALAAQAYPTQPEAPAHNLDEPLECWCAPEICEFYEEDGELSYLTVDHRWMQ